MRSSGFFVLFGILPSSTKVRANIFYLFILWFFFFFLLPKWVFLVRMYNPPVGRGRPLTFRFRQRRRTHMSSRPLDRIINVRHGKIYGWTNKFNARFVVVVREKPRTLHVRRTGTLFLTPPRPHRRVHSKRFLHYIVRHYTLRCRSPFLFLPEWEQKINNSWKILTIRKKSDFTRCRKRKWFAFFPLHPRDEIILSAAFGDNNDQTTYLILLLLLILILSGFFCLITVQFV